MSVQVTDAWVHVDDGVAAHLAHAESQHLRCPNAFHCHPHCCTHWPWSSAVWAARWAQCADAAPRRNCCPTRHRCPYYSIVFYACPRCGAAAVSLIYSATAVGQMGDSLQPRLLREVARDGDVLGRRALHSCSWADGQCPRESARWASMVRWRSKGKREWEKSMLSVDYGGFAGQLTRLASLLALASATALAAGGCPVV